MTPLSNRDDHEAAIAEAASQVLDEQFGLLKDELGEEPPQSGASETFWAALTGALTAALLPKLEAVYIDSVDEIALEMGIGWDEVTSSAAAWARSYTAELAGGIVTRRRELVAQSVADFYGQGLTLGDLYNRLAPEFGMQRAIDIGITETTRAASAGQKEFADMLRGRGIPMVDIVVTSNDERVCVICGPKHGKRASDESYPPYHVKCRCWVNSVPESDVEQYVSELP